MVFYAKLLSTLCGSLAMIASAIVVEQSPPSYPKLRTVARFSNETFIENLATRSNGNILVTILDRPEVYQINPFSPQEPQLVHRFAAPARGVAGIAEMKEDVFAVIVGPNYLDTKANRPVIPGGNGSIWTLDFRQLAPHIPHSPRLYNDPSCKPVVNKIATLSGVKFLDGLAYFRHGKLLLVGDIINGVVYRVNPDTGASSIALELPSMKPLPNAALPLGVNGLQMGPDDKELYFQNTSRMKFVSIPLKKDGSAAGPQRIIAHELGDDFKITPDARYAYIATNSVNSLIRLDLTSGKTVTVAGNQNSSALAGDTSVAFGRTRWDRNIAYVSCSGAILAPVNGTYIEGGKVVAVNLSQY